VGKGAGGKKSPKCMRENRSLNPGVEKAGVWAAGKSSSARAPEKRILLVEVGPARKLGENGITWVGMGNQEHREKERFCRLPNGLGGGWRKERRGKPLPGLDTSKGKRKTGWVGGGGVGCVQLKGQEKASLYNDDENLGVGGGKKSPHLFYWTEKKK